MSKVWLFERQEFKGSQAAQGYVVLIKGYVGRLFLQVYDDREMEARGCFVVKELWKTVQRLGQRSITI